jgi:hypothetical protein
MDHLPDDSAGHRSAAGRSAVSASGFHSRLSNP